MKLGARKLQLLQRFRASLSFFSSKCLYVRDKRGQLVNFNFNRAQVYVHERLEEQLRLTGRVRALLLKGRQQGASTYIAARFYAKATMIRGTNVYILAHEQLASDNLFKIVDRYHENNPIAPHTGASNAKVLEFDRRDSSYTVATAGQKAGGRSRTSSLFHGSEVAFWANAQDHFAASVQTVPDEPGTEIVLETTANGPTGEFYERWQAAETGDGIDGEGDYIAIFVPWFWQEEYYRAPPENFELRHDEDETVMDEVEYAEAFKLNDGQMYWRRLKIIELRSEAMFDQEYPATAQMAFVTSGTASFIPALPVLRARKRDHIEGAGPLVMGADPAGPGGDRFAICGRRGHTVEFLEWRNKIGTAEAYQWCKSVILEHEPARFFVDAGGIGAAVLSLLRGDEDIPKGVVKGVNFGSPSQAKLANPKKPGPKNRRAEMWSRLKEWLTGEEPVSIPDLDALQADITGPRLKHNLTNDIQLETKEAMRERQVRSPDLGDSLALTFASLTFIKDFIPRKLKKKYGNPDANKEPARSLHAPRRGGNGWMS